MGAEIGWLNFFSQGDASPLLASFVNRTISVVLDWRCSLL